MEKCSAVNTEFCKFLSAQLMQTLTPTQLSLPDPALLIKRLHSSEKLRSLFELVDFDTTAESAIWTCGAVNTGNVVTILLLPRQFYWRQDASSTALLPVILLQCTLDSDPATTTQGDTFLHYDLVTPPLLSAVAESMQPMLSQLSSLHTRCYLHLIHMALTQHWALASADYLTGLEICRSSSLSVDITPLLAALCSHAVTCFPANSGANADNTSANSSNTSTNSDNTPTNSGNIPSNLGNTPANSDNTPANSNDTPAWLGDPPGNIPADSGSPPACWRTCHPAPLQSDELCCLLMSALSRLTRTCCLLAEDGREEDSAPSLCSRCAQKVNQAFESYLEGVGFRPVSQCGPTHFWLDSGTSTPIKVSSITFSYPTQHGTVKRL